MQSSRPSISDPDAYARRYGALLQVSDSISQHRDLASLMHELAPNLHQVVSFTYLVILLYDEATVRLRRVLLETDSAVPMASMAIDSVSVEEAPSGLAFLHQKIYQIEDTLQESGYPELMGFLRRNGVRSHCSIPLTTPRRKIGVLVLGSIEPARLEPAELEFMQQVANQVAMAIANAQAFEEIRRTQAALAEKNERLELLLDTSHALSSNLNLRDLFQSIHQCCRRVVQHDHSGLVVYDREHQRLWLYAAEFSLDPPHIEASQRLQPGDSPAWQAVETRQPVLLNEADIDRYRLLAGRGLRSGCFLPLISRNEVVGVLGMTSTRPDVFRPEQVSLLQSVAGQIAVALENAENFRQIETLKDKLAEEKSYLEDEIRTQYNFEEIIGESRALTEVLQQITTVADSDSTVLILGETGTGKELVARAVHRLSARRERTFVKLNCAAIPTGLLESELFGHEKGAFTGAISQRIGRMELAHQGTLFLDEVGDIPLELQPKLLRALQEREFERLGSTRTRQVDMRLVAATNRDLGEMVNDRHFRSDLYYRLNVFPIRIPPLRERREDIPILVRHFTQKFARRMHKSIERISTESMSALSSWSWPGNVRELENFIERAVLLTNGAELNVPLQEIRVQHLTAAAPRSAGHSTTMEDAERGHILRVLREANGVVGGPNGAAARLGMKRTTLISRMKKLGIGTKPGDPGVFETGA